MTEEATRPAAAATRLGRRRKDRRVDRV